MKPTIKKFLRAVGLWNPLKKLQIRSGAHTRSLLSLYGPFVKKDDLVFDIGANVGDRAAIFWTLGARVVAVEPQPSCVEILHKQFERTPSVTVLPLGLGPQEGQAELSFSGERSVLASMSHAWQTKGRFAQQEYWTQKITVPVTTLDALISTYGTPAFCKIDVEGFEEEVLQGLSKKIPCLSFEFTKEFLDSVERSLVHLSRLGNISCNVSFGEFHTLASPTWMNVRELGTMLSEHDDPVLWGDIYVKIT